MNYLKNIFRNIPNFNDLIRINKILIENNKLKEQIRILNIQNKILKRDSIIGGDINSSLYSNSYDNRY